MTRVRALRFRAGIPNPDRRSRARTTLQHRILPLLLFAAMSTMAWDLWSTWRRIEADFAHERARRADSIAATINAAADILENREDLQCIVASIGQDRDVIAIWVVSGHPGRVMASTRFADVGKPAGAAIGSADGWSPAEQTDAFAYQLAARHADGHEAADGMIHLRLDPAETRSRLAHAQLGALLRNLARAAIVVATAYVLLLLFVVRPIREVLEAVRMRGDGQFANLAAMRTGDEIASLANEINRAFERVATANESARFYRDALDRACIIAVTDARGRILHANDRFCEISGFSRDELLGQDHRLVNSGTHEREFFSDLYRTIVAGRIWKGEVCNRAKDGSLYWVDTTIVPELAPDGKPVRFFAIRHDISARKAAEQSLHEAIALQQAIFESSSYAIITTDTQGVIMSFNRAAEALLGHLAEDVVGRHSPVIFHSPREIERAASERGLAPPANAREAFRILIAGAREGEPCARQWSFIRADESQVPVLVTVSAVRDDSGESLGYTVIAADISERVRSDEEIRKHTEDLLEVNARLEEQAFELAARSSELELARARAEAASHAKTDFLANMSHEIRTPMNAILGFADLLLEPTCEEQQRREHVLTIQRNGEHLLTLINDILDLSKIEAGRMTVESIDCAPAAIVTDVHTLLHQRAAAKSIALTFEALTPIPATIRSDPVRLRQILVNLTGNAIKFTEKGAVTIALRCDADPEGNLALSFAVRDSGIGIPANRLDDLFQPFTQADSTVTRRFGGTGLGLTISRRLAGALGGTIRAESTEGQGSTFTLTLHVGTAANVTLVEQPFANAPIPQRTQAARAGVAGSLQDVRFLLAEDGPDNQRLISHHLRTAGATVAFALNGREALELALAAEKSGQPFDIILMDMQMPIMSGYDAATLLREHHYSRPIIALTAHAMDGDRDQCINTGCDDYATKPVKRDVLIDTCRRWLTPDARQAAA